MSLLEQIQLAKADLDHLGSCTRTGKTPEQLAELDDKFYTALDRKSQLERQLATERYDAIARRTGQPTLRELEIIKSCSNHNF